MGKAKMKVQFSLFLVFTIILGMMQAMGFTKAATSDFVIDRNGVLTKYNGTDNYITIPNGVVTIAKGAFDKCKANHSIGGNVYYDYRLTRVDIPASVKEIQAGVFAGTTLESVSFADNSELEIIGNEVFRGCFKLSKLTGFPKGVKIIGNYAFYGCSALADVDLGDSLVSIGDYAFYGCSALADVDLGDSLTTIGARAFADCTGLAEVEMPGSLMTIGASAFSGCTRLAGVELSNGLTTIGVNAFGNCKALKTISIPGTVTLINGSAFSGCSELEKVFISEGVLSVGEKAFSACSKLVEVTLPDSLLSIGPYAFSGHGKMNLVIPKGVLEIGNCAFEGTAFDEVTAYSACSLAESGIKFETSESVLRGYKGTLSEVYATLQSCVFVPLDTNEDSNNNDEKLIGCSVDLSDIINLKFYFKLEESDVESGVSANITYLNGKSEVRSITSANICNLPGGEKAYFIECKVAPKEVGDEIVIYLTSNDTSEAITKECVYSVKEYCQLIIDGDFSEMEKEVARALLTYAMYSQIYFGYRTSNLVLRRDEAFISSQAKVKDYLAKLPGNEYEGSLPQGVGYHGSSLVLNSSIKYRLYFEVEDESIAQQYGMIQNNANGLFYVEDVPVSITDLRNLVEFHIGDAVIKSCPLSYVVNVVNGDNGVRLTDVCVALYDYYAAARDYVSSRNQQVEENETSIK